MSELKFCSKICLLGNSRSGKSTYINRLIGNNSSIVEIEPTIGVDFNCHVIEKNNYKYKFQFYDTSGLPNFYKITANYYDITNIFIIFIEVKNSKESDLSYWYNEIKNHKKNKNLLNNLKVIIIANKIDLFDNNFTQEKFMKSYKSKFKSLNAELYDQDSIKLYISSENIKTPLINNNDNYREDNSDNNENNTCCCRCSIL